MSDIGSWLEQHDLGKYVTVFAENEIMFSDLPELADKDIEALGLPLGPRRRLQKAIRELIERDASRANPSIAPKGEAERRQLTLMFADLVGSTELSSRLDPEKLREINRSYQDAAKTSIERFGGYVARYMGDGVLAYFGYPQAHEDDAERAVRAGLDLVTSVPALPSEAELAVRVGIATGPVVVGDLIGEGASQENAVVGETPNLAARLQAIANPNSTVISSSTQRLVAGRFELASLGLQNLKGIARPVLVFRVLHLADSESRFNANALGRLSPLIGRDDELMLVQRRWQRAVSGEFQLVLISGEPGIGKSRLVQAARDAARDDAHTVLLYQCSPFYTSSSFQPFITQLRRVSRLQASDSPQHQLSQLEALLRRSAGFLPHDVPMFGALLGIPCELPPSLSASEERRNETVLGLLRQLRGLAQERPVLFIFEDLHWADPSTLEVLDRIVHECLDDRVMLLATYRPEFGCPWLGRAQTTSVLLNRMSARETARLISSISEKERIPEHLISTIVERTDGVPLFVEELTRTVVELEGDRSKGRGRDLARDAIPSSLHDSLMERLDRLGEAKEVAQAASILGREFTRNQVHTISQLGFEIVDDAIQALQQAELVFKHGETDINVRYVFKHALVQDAAYQSLLTTRRQRLHQRAAEMLVGQATPPEVIAYHFDEAGRPSEALAKWHEAGRQASANSAHTEALEYLEKGVRLINALPDDDERAQRECDIQLDLAGSMRVVDRLDEAFQALERAELLARSLEDSERLSRIHYLRGNLYFPRGRIDECLSEHERAREEARRAQSVALEARALGGLCDANYLRGRMITAHAFAHECVSLAEANQLPEIAAANLGMRGATSGYQLRLKDATTDSFRGAEMADSLLLHRAAIVNYQIAGYFLLEAGEQAAAAEALRHGLERAREIGARRFEPISLRYLSEIHFSEGNVEEARLCALEAKRISDETAPAFTGPWSLGATMLVARNDSERREACAEAARIFKMGCASHNHFWFHRDAMDAWLCAGNPKAALEHAMMLETHTSEEPLPWTDFYIRRTRGLARLMTGDRSAVAHAAARDLIAEARDAGLKRAIPLMQATLEGRPFAR